MIPFAVTVKDVTEPGQALWVLAVSRESLLTAYGDGTFHWHKLADCRFAKLIPPDAPQPVFVVQQQPGLVYPGASLQGLKSNGG